MKFFIEKFNLSQEYNRLTIVVPLDAVNELKKILSKDKPIGKAFTNIAKTYVFLYWLNRQGETHVAKQDLATMIYAKHVESLTKGLTILKQNNLITVNYQKSQTGWRSYYTYKVAPFDYGQTFDEIVEYEFDIPIVTGFQLYGKGNKIISCGSKMECSENKAESSSLHIHSSCPHINNYTDAFKSQFIGWYDELSFGGQIVPQGQFSMKDRRFYHRFHAISKAERLSTVLWDDEHVVEVWDAHSAFFIIIGFYLKYVKVYESEDERQKFAKEADHMMRLAMEDCLYWSIQQYHNKHAQPPVYCINRDKAKELAQKYINKSYKRLFKKNGERTNHIDAMWCRYIDEFFQKNFPNIRLWMLNYQRRPETKDVEFERNGKKIVFPNTKVSVSQIHQDIMPYEFQLISMGLCKDIFDLYKIKSVTVHDAIYMKASDAKKISDKDIDELFSQRLGLSERIPRSYALF